MNREFGTGSCVTLNTDLSATGTTARPNRIADGALPAEQRSVKQWFNTGAFVAPSCIWFGNSGRGVVRGPGFLDLDLGIICNFHVNERFRLQFRAESFNLLNHPNLGLPNFNIGNPLAGNITTTIN